jgi:hypothetical protein
MTHSPLNVKFRSFDIHQSSVQDRLITLDDGDNPLKCQELVTQWHGIHPRRLKSLLHQFLNSCCKVLNLPTSHWATEKFKINYILNMLFLVNICMYVCEIYHTYQLLNKVCQSTFSLSHSQLTMSAERHCLLCRESCAMSLRQFKAYVQIMFCVSFYMSSTDGSIMTFRWLLRRMKAIFLLYIKMIHKQYNTITAGYHLIKSSWGLRSSDTLHNTASQSASQHSEEHNAFTFKCSGVQEDSLPAENERTTPFRNVNL